MGQAAFAFLLSLLQRMSNPRKSVPICVILLTEKEGISTWTCHILWPVAYWNGRWWQNKQHSFSQCLSDSLKKTERAVDMKCTSTISKIIRGLSRMHLMESRRERAAEHWRKLPLSATFQMEDLPTEILAGECCQGKGPLVGLLLPFLADENKG